MEPLPRSVICPAPGPLMFIAVSAYRPSVAVEPTLIVPLRPEAKTMSSDPGPFELASRIACRRLPEPSSLRFVTVNVAASALPATARVAPIAMLAPAITCFRLSTPRSACCRRRCCFRRRSRLVIKSLPVDSEFAANLVCGAHRCQALGQHEVVSVHRLFGGVREQLADLVRSHPLDPAQLGG